MRITGTIIMLALCFPAALRAQDFNILKYGARPDTTVLSTNAIQKAIDACHAKGGGRVVIPAGQYKTGSIFLKDNVHLYLSAGATLYGSPYKKDYTAVKTVYKAFRLETSTIQLIYAEGIKNSGISGDGTIDGQGRFFQRAPGVTGHDEGIERPHLLRFINCRDITVTDVTLRNSGCWMQHYLACDNVRISGVRVYNHSTKNNDAVDIDGCRNVVISGLVCDSDDDGITLKSTSPRVTENVNITGCVVSSHCNAIKLGTESVGGFRNILISDCIIKPSEHDSMIFGYEKGISGVSIEMTDGGILENVTVSDLIIDGPQAPLYVRLGNRARPWSADAAPAGVGILRNVTISNILAVNVGNLGSSVTGIPGYPVENISIRDVTIRNIGQPDPEAIVTAEKVREDDKGYPEAFGFVGRNGSMPASGIFFRHVKGLKLDNVIVDPIDPDPRPALVFVDVTD